MKNHLGKYQVTKWHLAKLDTVQPIYFIWISLLFVLIFRYRSHFDLSIVLVELVLFWSCLLIPIPLEVIPAMSIFLTFDKTNLNYFFHSCTSKFAGEFCQHPSPCHSESSARCQNGGSCRVRSTPQDRPPSFACDCPLGFSASLCEIRVPTACDSSPCLNGATCRLTSLETYECDCPPGYTGNHLIFLFD